MAGLCAIHSANCHATDFLRPRDDTNARNFCETHFIPEIRVDNVAGLVVEVRAIHQSVCRATKFLPDLND
jgi:hypothetical protein